MHRSAGFWGENLARIDQFDKGKVFGSMPSRGRMAAVAKRSVFSFLTAAKENRFGLFGLEGQRRKSGAFVAAVAKGLRGASAAGTPGIGLAFLDVDVVRGALGDDRFVHEFS